MARRYKEDFLETKDLTKWINDQYSISKIYNKR